MARVELVRQVLAAGLRWLFDTEQPPDALVRDGHASAVVDEVRYTFIVRADGRAVVAAATARPQFGRVDDRTVVTNPLSGEMLAAIRTALDRLRVVDQKWGGPESISWLLVGAAHPTLVDARRRTDRGCPSHGRVTDWSAGGCGWLERGTVQLVPPRWPVGVSTASAWPGGEDDRQVGDDAAGDEVEQLVPAVQLRVVGESEAVRQVLAVLHEVLVFEDPGRLVPRRNPPERAGRYREQSAYLRDVRIRAKRSVERP